MGASYKRANIASFIKLEAMYALDLHRLSNKNPNGILVHRIVDWY
jgi:hypothetical protein